MKTKTRRILEYIRDNQPCRAKDICEAILKRRYMKANRYTKRTYFYYPGWSGFRAYLTAWGYQNKLREKAIRLSKAGYVLTAYGRKLLK